ncbi:MAG TPA: serine/threonine-protein kinase, partial [Gemmataceae bacterium]|nr:serine/threonine-protein kinase [Gemmataceae bacterium]
MTRQQICPDPLSLKNLLQGALPAEEQATLTGHLDTCLTCQQTLEFFAKESSPWPKPVLPLASSAPTTGSAFHRVMQELKGGPAEAATLPGAGTVAEPILDLLTPTDIPDCLGKLGSYEIDAVIGRGGMGVVLKGRDATLNRFVAIKVLAPQLATSEAARKRFARESKAAAAVNHENIVAIHAVDEFAGLPFIVMEYVWGISLQEKLDQTGPLELKEILRIGKETAAGLASAHARGLIHRDIKPSNILLVGSGAGRGKETMNSVDPSPLTPHPSPGRIKITDFGLARAIDDASLTQTGVVAGTPQYMAPEQARAEPLDARADLFSLGSLLYALCTGRPPFPAGPAVSVLYTVCQDTPLAIQKINPGIPDWLVAIITKLHAKNPADRIQSAAEVADLLEKHLAHLENPQTVPQPAPLPEPKLTATPAKRYGRGYVLAAALMLLALGVTGYLFGPAIFRFFTDQGEIEIKTDDSHIAVIVNEKGVKIHDRLANREYLLKLGRQNVKSGDYEIDVTEPDGIELSTTKFTLKRGGVIVLSASSAPKGNDNVIQGAWQENRGANLLVNPGFEDAADSEGEQPTYWIDEAKTTASEPEAQCYRDTTVKYRGNASVVVQKLPKVGISKLVEAGFSQQLFQLPSNEMVYLGGFLRSRNVEGSASIKLRLMDKKGKWLGDHATDAVKGSTDWTRYETPIKIPAEAHGVVILALQGRGTVWFDEVYVHTEKSSKFVPFQNKKPVKHPHAVFPGTELLWNGGFDKMTDDLPLCWKSYEPGIQGVTLKGDKEIKRSGTAS